MGAVAGFTIYLGFPILFLNNKAKVRAFFNAVSVGVLLFIFVEMSYRLIEGVEQRVKLSLAGMTTSRDLWSVIAIFVGGFLISLMGLVLYEVHFIRNHSEDKTAPFSPKKLAMLIAIGIGLHNFSEGLVIGQSFLGGALSLGYMLVVGFALHNATEGFGIVAPMSGERPSFSYVLLLGFVGGGPTFFGTILGSFYYSEYLSLFFMALASGAILYIVGELIHIGKLKAQHIATTFGLLVGFFLAFGSDMIIERAQAMGTAKGVAQNEVRVIMKEYVFVPSQSQIPSNTPTRLVLENQGTMDHEMEILGLPEAMEVELKSGMKSSVILPGLSPGRYKVICDMPGHLMAGMKGELLVGNLDR